MGLEHGTSVCLAAALILVSSVARGEEEPKAPLRPEGRAVPRWRLGLAVATEVPFGVSGDAVLESPGRIRFTSGVGVVPRPYFTATAAAVGAAVGVGPRVQELLVDAAANSLQWRVGMGYRPSATGGWFFQTGYGVLALGGSVTTGAAIDAALAEVGLEAFSDLAGAGLAGLGYGDRRWETAVTMHRWWFEIGHTWTFLEEHLYLTLAFGFSVTMAASTDFVPTLGRVYATDDVQAALDEASRLIDTRLRSFAHVPTLSLRLGGRVLGPARNWE